MERKLRCLKGFLGLIIMFTFVGVCQAAEFPTKSMEWLAPFGPGGPSAISLKFIGDAASKLLGQPVLVVAAPGAAGTVAGARVARAKPDGYTLLGSNSATNGTALFLKKDLTYSNNDFEFLAEYGAFDLGLAVKADSPFKTLEEYIEYAKKNPSVIKCATTGAGGADHLSSELLSIETGGLKIDYVPFKSPFEKRNAILGGHVHSGFIYGGGGGPGDEFRQMLDGGGRILAVTTKVRLKAYPDVSTFSERGLNVVLSSWYGIAGPKGMPKEVSKKLNDAIYKVMKEPETIKVIESLGFRYEFRDSEEFTKFVKEREKLVERIIKEAGIPAN